MKYAIMLLLGCLVLTGCQSICFKVQCGQSAGADPSVSTWVGTWVDTRKADHGGDLNCEAKQTGDDRWEARFYGNCGREYSYQIDMVGQREGERVKFEGDVDLGKADGGVYTWTGYIDGDKFTGEYTTAAGKAGHFEMTRKN